MLIEDLWNLGPLQTISNPITRTCIQLRPDPSRYQFQTHL